MPALGGGPKRLRPGGGLRAGRRVANGYRRAMAACLSGRGYSVN
ncbi:hypothetical protein CLJ1_0886 [Pseudomonas paraeruginosa]|nr:hypothetical protein CLJ1_0886 [Pseudomonas aeruginosa]